MGGRRGHCPVDSENYAPVLKMDDVLPGISQFQDDLFGVLTEFGSD